jgi:2-deoxy-D-gluconate 3-dehydrogenase
LTAFSADLAGKVALVTGGTRGIGRVIAEALLANGAAVTVSARTTADVAAAEAQLSALGKAFGYPCDVSKETDVGALFAAAIERFGQLDILFNNAGIAPSYRRAEAIPIEEFDQILATNVRGTFLCSMAAGRHMMERGGGVIVNVGSASGVRGMQRLAAYSASKGAVARLTEVLAAEWAQHGIRVNTIAPGWIETDLNRPLLNSRHGERIVDRTPQHRWAQPEEIAGLAVYLASEASSFVTGQSFVIDGGFIVG